MSTDELMFVDEVQRYLGLDAAHTVRREASATRRRIREGGEARPYDMPLPVDRVLVQVATTVPGVHRTASRPRWRKADIDAMLAARAAYKRPRGNDGKFARAEDAA